ncbi:MAG: DoxX family protein [candidate division Zixibacteria bacterium]|nr:DoxX family protein [candidate division Zixibacteria bacterium]
MNLKRFFQPLPHPCLPSAALLLLRVVVGSAFILHGWGKIQHPFSWAPPQSPLTIPGIFQSLAAISEFGGGIALILGLLTPLAALGIGSTMTVALYLHMIVRKDPFVNMTGGPGFELPAVYFGIAVLILALGPGKFSLDAKIFSSPPKNGEEEPTRLSPPRRNDPC